MHPIHVKFAEESKRHIQNMAQDATFCALSKEWTVKALEHKYVYNWSWMGIPIIQFPTDIMAEQELIFQTQPDIIVETGIAHGGSLVFHASMLELLPPSQDIKRRVIGVDIDIREHNRVRIENHPMFKRIEMIQGSSIDHDIVKNVFDCVGSNKKVMLILDSSHTYEHVKEELRLYSPLVSKGMYMIVQDTIVEDLSQAAVGDRAWGKGNNPYTAVNEFLTENSRFEVDAGIDAKCQFTCQRRGYLRCIND